MENRFSRGYIAPKRLSQFRKIAAAATLCVGLYTTGVVSTLAADKFGLLGKFKSLDNSVHGPNIPIAELSFDRFENPAFERERELDRMKAFASVCTVMADMAYLAGPPETLTPVDNDGNGVPETYMGTNAYGGIARFYLEPDGKTYVFRRDTEFLSGLDPLTRKEGALPGQPNLPGHPKLPGTLSPRDFRDVVPDGILLPEYLDRDIR